MGSRIVFSGDDLPEDFDKDTAASAQYVDATRTPGSLVMEGSDGKPVWFTFFQFRVDKEVQTFVMPEEAMRKFVKYIEGALAEVQKEKAFAEIVVKTAGEGKNN